ncbi:hypothetical protein HPP92_018498 [Vanilla planifolia]|uniref:Uncharacterized protein n=1 Tax=Vanilla planifolia TaxID=51239 RepID=A0A835QEJ2_VANPL|nr:hypothetical protein HPP92_018498 [Vanilla planifolia]
MKGRKKYSVNSDLCQYLMADHKDTPVTELETHRLAVVNMDWDHIKVNKITLVNPVCQKHRLDAQINEMIIK